MVGATNRMMQGFAAAWAMVIAILLHRDPRIVIGDRVALVSAFAATMIALAPRSNGLGARLAVVAAAAVCAAAATLTSPIGGLALLVPTFVLLWRVVFPAQTWSSLRIGRPIALVLIVLLMAVSVTSLGGAFVVALPLAGLLIAWRRLANPPDYLR